MRRYITHRKFNKMFIKLPRKVQAQCIDRMRLFIAEPCSEIVNDHALHADWAGHRSINVSGDYRAIYKEIAPDAFEFVAIGTHHQLFGK